MRYGLNKIQSQEKFVAWVKKFNPKLYRAAVHKVGQKNLSADNVASPPAQKKANWLDSLVGTISTLAPSYLQFRQQKDLMKMQLKRAEKGLPPANVNDYTPVLKVQTGLSPETQKAMVSTGLQISKPLIYGGLFLVGAYLYSNSKKRR